MTRETIVKILENAGAKSQAKGSSVPDGVELTVLVATDGDLLSIPRLARVEFADSFVTFETTKGERCFFAYESVLGFRASDLGQAKDRGAGFGR